MGDPGQEPRPGANEIVLSAADDKQLCNTLQHTKLGCLAEVVATFGELGVKWQRNALWQDSWGRSYPLCSECWDTMRQIAQSRRPGLVITDTRDTATRR